MELGWEDSPIILLNMAWWDECTTSAASTLKAVMTQPLLDAGSFDNILWCNTLWVCLCVNITAYNVLISPGTVSTDWVSFATVTVHEVGGQDGKQTDTHEKEVLFWDGFLCLVPLMAVSVPVKTKARCTLGCAQDICPEYSGHRLLISYNFCTKNWEFVLYFLRWEKKD